MQPLPEARSRIAEQLIFTGSAYRTIPPRFPPGSVLPAKNTPFPLASGGNGVLFLHIIRIGYLFGGCMTDGYRGFLPDRCEKQKQNLTASQQTAAERRFALKYDI